MFRQGNIPVRFNTILPRQHETKDGKEIGLLECQCEINPFSAKLATDLDDFVRSTLYTRTDAEVVSKLGAATFRLTMPPQEITVKAAPDQEQESFTILEAKIGALHAKRSKKSPTWRLVFTLLFQPSTEHQLAQVMACHTRSRYLTFGDAEADLFTEVSKEEKRHRRGVAASDAAATATH